jgi:hypothetical protein
MNDLEKLRADWSGRWPDALADWSRFVKLSEPRWCLTEKEEKQEGLSGSFAMIRLPDQAVVISLRQVRERGLERFAREIAAHEIGHHVYCPGNMTDQGRMVARMRRALPTREHLAPVVANLYSDLLINDRLQRSGGLDIAGVYRQMRSDPDRPPSRTWTFYMRSYEILWSLPTGTLAEGRIDPRLEGDAQLCARLVRSYAREWLDGAGRFAALALPYLLEDGGEDVDRLLRGWLDARSPGHGAAEAPFGLTEVEAAEAEGAIHPALDRELAGLDDDYQPPEGPPEEAEESSPSTGQYREPFEYGEILRSLGLDLSDHEIAVRYYRERAAPHLVRFPVRRMPESTEPLPEGLQTWEIGAPLEDADWLQSVLVSPHVVPGMTTVQRTWGVEQGAEPEKRPVDLDLYVDSSGSMPNPQAATSYLTIAGAIVALSALRVGARVQATLWSGARQFETTGGFVTDPLRVLRILTGYLGGATAFPIHLLRETYAPRRPGDRPVHILVISDDGVDTMFQKDEWGNEGRQVSRAALARAGGGGTMVLNLWQDWEQIPELVQAHEDGWRIHRVRNWEDLVAFARAFSRESYAQEERDAGRGAGA